MEILQEENKDLVLRVCKKCRNYFLGFLGFIGALIRTINSRFGSRFGNISGNVSPSLGLLATTSADALSCGFGLSTLYAAFTSISTQDESGLTRDESGLTRDESGLTRDKAILCHLFYKCISIYV